MNTAVALTTPCLFGNHEQLVLPVDDSTPLVPVAIERESPDEVPTVLRDRAAVLLQAIAEILSGQRAAQQLAGWFTPEVFWLLRRQLAHGRSPVSGMARGVRANVRGTRPRIASVHVSMVSPAAAEVCARMVHGQRSRALAIRLENRPDHRGSTRWVCTFLTWA